MLEVGDQAPPFRGRDQEGRDVALEDLLSKGPLVLYFYPRDFTPVCTKEACLFRDAHQDLAQRGAQVVGVSADTGDSHKAFAEKHRLRFPLLSDPNRKLAKDYRATHPFGLGTQRVTYVIGQDGRIRGAFHHELRAQKHVDEVLTLLLGTQVRDGD
jgi:peroxiredoxin Q/BCP